MAEQGHLAFIWHLHQPFFIPDEEVAEKAVTSYMNLLRLHEELDIPLTLNVTGTLLQRVSRVAPSIIETVISLIERQVVELLGSAYYHPVLPLLSYQDAKAHIDKDIALKKQVFQIDPSGFWPTELAWSPWLTQLIAERGVQWVLTDSSSVIMGNALPEWSSRFISGHEFLQPEIKSVTLEQELCGPYLIECGSKRVVAVIRHQRLSTMLSKFDEGVLWKPAHVKEFIDELRQLLNGNFLVVLADDAEKITPQTLLVYKKLLQTFADKISLISPLLSTYKAIEAKYLPASTFQYDIKAWLSTFDDIVLQNFIKNVSDRLYFVKTILAPLGLKQNSELHQKLEQAQELILRAQDSSCLFWKFLKRTRQPCYDCLLKANAILDQIIEDMNEF